MNVKSAGPIVVTVLVFVAFFCTLYILGDHIGADPKTDADGNVISDPYQRSKDLFTVVVSLVTATLGYWYGADGKAEAQDQAAKSQAQSTEAQNQVAEIHAEMNRVQNQKAAFLAAGDQDLLTKARQQSPEAFS